MTTPSASRSLSGGAQTRLFLDTILGNRPEGTHFLVWRFVDRTTKISRSFTDVGEAVAYIQAHNGQGNLYFGAGLADKPVASENTRYRASQIVSVPALWIDIDIADPLAHQKQALPPTREAARELLQMIQLPPTILVDSGHGFQAWWVFKEPLVITDNDEQVEAQQIVNGWNMMFQAFARQKGWEVDSTHDLARVMRVPGVLNMKVPTHPVPVQIDTFEPQNVYDLPTVLHTIEYWLRELPDQPSDIAAIMQREVNIQDTATGLRCNSNAMAPRAKWDALIKNNAKAGKTYLHTRNDLAGKSMSEHDMALAVFAVQAEWTDQEITDLLIQHRRERSEPAKINRPDYFARTIVRARAYVQRTEDHKKTFDIPTPVPVYEESAASLEEPINDGVEQSPEISAMSNSLLGDDGEDEIAWEPGMPTGNEGVSDAALAGYLEEDNTVAPPPVAQYAEPTNAIVPEASAVAREGADLGPTYSTMTAVEVQRREALSFLNQVLGPEVTVREVRYLVGASAGTYQLLIQQGPQEYWFQIEAGEAAEFTSFKRVWFRATRILREPMKAHEWAKVGTWLGIAAQVIDLGDDTAETVELHEWFDQYLETHALNRTWRLENATPPEMDGGYIKDGFVYIQVKEFCQYINNGAGGKIVRAALTKRMTVAGFERSKQNFTQRTGRMTSRSVWRAPAKWGDPWLEESVR